MITIKIVSQSTGKPLKRRKVVLGFSGLLSGGVTNAEYTDDEGEAHFNTDPREGEVYVDGSTKHKGNLSGRVVVYV